MNTLLFQKVIEFMTQPASHDPHSPVVQQGVQVHLDGRQITFVAVKAGATTTVVMRPQAVSGGKGKFVLPFDEIENFIPVLRHENSAPQDGTALVTFSRSVQPLVKNWVSLKINISDWYEGHVGIYREHGFPKRSAGHHNSTFNQEALRTSARTLSALSDGKGFGWKLERSGEYLIELVKPIAGVKSVSKLIY